MLHATVRRTAQLIVSVLVLFGAIQAGSVSAGSDVWTGHELEGGDTPALQTSLRPPAIDVTICDEVSEIPPNECAALVALYQSTNGSGWTRQDGWLATNTPCSWYGVFCEAGHVRDLSLRDNQLSGSIPAQLGDLVNLQVLSLSTNQLSGSIPAELGNLGHLQELWLANNQLRGSIPAELGNLINLEVLSLPENQLSDRIPPEFGNLDSLGQLFLSNNLLSGSVPPELGNLTTNLYNLVVSQNPLSGPLPRRLTDLHLSTFYFQGTHLCELSDAAFQTWLTGIPHLQRSGLVCSVVYLPLCLR